MGGKALKSIVTRRCSRTEFDQIRSELIPVFKEYFDRVDVPLFYNSKESFGDIDILVQVEGHENIRDIITDRFNPTEIFHNGNCYSFDYKLFQVDLITTSKEHFGTLCNYLCFNDLNNLVGKLARPLGLRFGQKGLVFEYHDVHHQHVENITISTDYHKTCDFLGLNYEKYKQGFETLEEIFEFIIASKYFDYHRYQLEALNHVNRERDVKRTSYMSFLTYLREKNIKKECEFEKDKSKYIPMINEFFPEANLLTEIKRLDYECAKKAYIQSKFNGDKIIKKYNLQGKELGEAIIKFKSAERFYKNFDDYVLNTKEKDIWFDFEVINDVRER